MKQKLVIALIACSLMQPQVSWARTESEQLEKVIQSVKEKISVPSSCSEFSYNLYDDAFSLTWHNKDNTESMDVSSTQDGDILSYYHYNEDSSNGKNLAEVDVEKAQQIAEKFLDQVVPQYAQDLKLINEQTPRMGENYDFNYNLMYQKIKVHEQLVDISINKHTGEVEGFNGIRFDKNAKYDSAVPTLTEEKAYSLYLSEIGLPLGYHTYFDEKDNERAFLAYYLNSKDDAISAKNGKKLTMYQEDHIKYAGGAMDAGMGVTEDIASDTENLTPNEQKAVESTKEYITPEKIKQNMSTYFPVLNTMEILNTSIQNNRFGDERYINMGVKKEDAITAQADLSCDAKTGELYYYSYYLNGNDTKIPGKQWTNAQAEEFIQKVSPNQSKQVTLTNSEINDYNKALQNFTFTRLYKGIPVCDDGITLTYNTSSKEVEAYSVNWCKNMSFPSSEGILSKEEMVKQIGLELYYMQTGAHDYSLVYTTPANDTLFDAFGGKVLNWQGQEVHTAINGFYTDIAGNKAEEIIKKLYNSGIYLEESQLKPDETISQQEFLRLVGQAMSWFEDDASVYKNAAEQGILPEAEKVPDKKLTREEGLIYLINATPYKKLAMQSELYQYPYEDQDISSDLKGYVTVAYGLNILDKNAKKFAPKAELTKADAMVMIYNLLQDDTKSN